MFVFVHNGVFPLIIMMRVYLYLFMSLLLLNANFSHQILFRILLEIWLYT